MSLSKGNSSKLRNLKVNTPDKFSGAKRHKCNQFVSACGLYFRAKHLRSDEDEATFAGSYLTGAARRWFDTYPTGHSVLLDWATFVAELKKRHGKQDPHGSAIRRISALQMKDSDHVSDFLVKFAECQALINWEDKAGSALLVRFYDMLPCRLKQVFTLSSKCHLHLNLYKLQAAALDLDWDYWDYKAHKRTSDTRPEVRSLRNAPASRRNRPARKDRGDAPRGPPAQERSNNRYSSLQRSPVSGSNAIPLGPNSKLTPKEHERRTKRGSCTMCDEMGHFAAQCPKGKPCPAGGRPAGRFKQVTATFSISASNEDESKN